MDANLIYRARVQPGLVTGVMASRSSEPPTGPRAAGTKPPKPACPSRRTSSSSSRNGCPGPPARRASGSSWKRVIPPRASVYTLDTYTFLRRCFMEDHVCTRVRGMRVTQVINTPRVACLGRAVRRPVTSVCLVWPRVCAWVVCGQREDPISVFSSGAPRPGGGGAREEWTQVRSSFLSIPYGERVPLGRRSVRSREASGVYSSFGGGRVRGSSVALPPPRADLPLYVYVNLPHAYICRRTAYHGDFAPTMVAVALLVLYYSLASSALL